MRSGRVKHHFFFYLAPGEYTGGAVIPPGEYTGGAVIPPGEYTGGAVTRWKQAYEAGGEAGLAAKPHPGGQPRLRTPDRRRLGRLLLQGPRRHGYRTELWTLARVAEVIAKTFGVQYHPCHVWKVLRGMGWSCQKPERRTRERDEKAIRRWREERWPDIKKRPTKRP
jgi:transposase